MLYIRFLNLQNPLQDVEQLYKDGTIEQGDIVCQQYTNKYSHLFMNGTWVKTKYISKIAQNTEVEDDVKTLYDSIVNISTNLSDNYLTKTQYLKDEELVASSFADVNNKINAQSKLLDNNSTNITDISTKLSNYITKTQYLKDEELVASAFAELNNKINSQSKLIDNNSKNISNISTNLSDNYLTKEQYLKDEELIASSFADVNNKINAQSELLNNNSTNISNISAKLSNYLTKEQYLKDEELIASSFANVNNKINSLYAEISKLKEQLNNKA